MLPHYSHYLNPIKKYSASLSARTLTTLSSLLLLRSNQLSINHFLSRVFTTLNCVLCVLDCWIIFVVYYKKNLQLSLPWLYYMINEMTRQILCIYVQKLLLFVNLAKIYAHYTKYDINNRCIFYQLYLVSFSSIFSLIMHVIAEDVSVDWLP